MKTISITDNWEYSKKWSKENECDVHLFEITTMAMYQMCDVVTFVNSNYDELECEINTVDDYSFNGYYVCGSDLIDHLKGD